MTTKDLSREALSAQDRATADTERTNLDGTALSMAERKARLRSEWSQDILPPVTGNPEYHYIWLSTTNSADPIYRRLQLGYELVKLTEFPEMAQQHGVSAGEFAGCISINEMILAKIHTELFHELMLINHHERPLQEEELLKANAVPDEEDSNGRPLGMIEGDGIKKMGVRVRAPGFEG